MTALSLALVLFFTFNKPTLSADQIMDLVLERDALREERLEAYEVTREYRVENKRWNQNASMVVRLRFRHPDEKYFEVVSEDGSNVIRKRVLSRLLDTERDVSLDREKSRHSIDSTNYSFVLAADASVSGRSCYVVKAAPKRKDELLFTGLIYVDKQDLAIARIEGEVSKSPSFWITRILFVREFQKIGEFWLPAGVTSVAHVRIFGPTDTKVSVIDYQLIARQAAK